MTNCNAGCPSRKVAGFTLIQHREPCAWAPVDVCGDCSYAVVPDQDHEHEMCPNQSSTEPAAA